MEILKIKVMELNDFVAKFAEQFDETDASEFTPETYFHELEECIICLKGL